MHLRLEVGATRESWVLALFKQIQFEADDDVNDEVQFSYSVMIPKTKTTLFSLVICYVYCGVSFRMASNIIGCTYDVLATLVFTLLLPTCQQVHSGCLCYQFVAHCWRFTALLGFLNSAQFYYSSKHIVFRLVFPCFHWGA
jgi:hypothetical protein